MGSRAIATAGVVAAAAIALTAAVAPHSARAADRTIGDTTVLAAVPYPGHPGGIVVDGDTAYVDTFNPVTRATDDYDAIFTYDIATGKLRDDRPNPIRVPRMMSPTVMGLAAMALDAHGRLYVADMNGRIVRVDPETGDQTDYAMFPTSSATSLSEMPDGIAFDKRGNLYVTDGSAPIIWRVPPGGGVAKAWLVDPLLPSAWASGLDGAAIDPSGTFLYFTEGYGSATAVYRVPLDRPEPSAVELVHLYGPPAVTVDRENSEIHGVFGVSAIAFGASARLYVTLVGPNQISVLRPDGTEEIRFPDADRHAPYDNPLFPAFDGHGSLLVTNLAMDDAAKSKVLSAWVDDRALPLIRPSIPR